MKTVHIITRLIVGGAQENTLHTCEDQHALFGDDVTLVTGPETGPEGSLLDRAKAGGYRVEVVDDLRRSIRPLRDRRAFRRLKELLHKINPAVVHTHSSKAGILGRAAARRWRLPCVHTVHGASFHYGQPWPLYRAYVTAEKWAAKRCDHFISVCDAMTREYVQAGVAAEDHFTTVYSGFDVGPFLEPPKPPAAVREEFGLSPEDVVVTTVARLFPLKGHETLLQAAPKIVAADPRVKFLWVGDGVLRSEYERGIASLGLSDRFVFTGLVPPTRVPELIHAADIVAHPSQWEGLARVLPQGLIAGKPCVTYDVGGAAEVVLDGETGRVLELNDWQGMADAVIELAADADLRRRYGDAGRELCRDLFDHAQMSRRIREVYARVRAQHFSKE